VLGATLLDAPLRSRRERVELLVGGFAGARADLRHPALQVRRAGRRVALHLQEQVVVLEKHQQLAVAADELEVLPPTRGPAGAREMAALAPRQLAGAVLRVR